MKPSQQRTIQHITAKVLEVVETAHTNTEWDTFYTAAFREHADFAATYAAHYQATRKPLPASHVKASHKAATARVAAYRALIPALAVALDGTLVEVCEPVSPYAAFAFKHQDHDGGFLVHSATPVDYSWSFDSHAGVLRSIAAVIAAIVLAERREQDGAGT